MIRTWLPNQSASLSLLYKATDDGFEASIEAPANNTDISALEETPEQFQVASQIDDASLDDDYLSDNHDDLADLIVAESFPQNNTALRASFEDDTDDIELAANDKPRQYDVASWGEPVVNFEKAEEPAAPPQAEATPAAAETTTEVAAEVPAETSTRTAPADYTEPGGESPEHATAASVAIAADINVGALVDDITRKLMPEIEWKVRMRLREVLDDIFPEK